MLIGLFFLAVLASLYWFAWRPLPRTSGTLQLPVSAKATIQRDGQGTPHIQAATLDDALFLQGYATAQDRLWQMDMLRRNVAGELSAVVGSRTLSLDQESRRLRLRRIAEAALQTITPEEKRILAAYARGVNYFVETHRQVLPLEFSLMGYDPRPWSIVDSIGIGLLMYRNLTTSWQDELHKQHLLAGGDAAKVDLLWPARQGTEVQLGSNAWVLAGSRTATGKPLLANDPHLEFTLPATWYMVHLQTPEMNVAGVSLPGLPGVVIGHNDRIAWGVTNLHFDVQDLYAEKIDLASGRYLYQGKQEQAQLERELIPVKGEKPVEFRNLVTRHGPIMVTEKDQALTLRWTAAEPGTFSYPFLQVDRARDWSEFRAALSHFPGPGQNFLYADTAGHIGYQATGFLPIRRGTRGDVPVDGSSGESEWQGFIPYDQLPSVLDPPSGLLITANQNPFPANFAHPVNGNFAPGYRSRQIQALLSARQGWKAEDMLTVQKDVYSAYGHFLAQQAVASFDRKGKQMGHLADAVNVLRSWSGQMEKGLAAPMIVTLLGVQVRRMIADKASPGKAGEYEPVMSAAVVEMMLRSRPQDWFPDYDTMILQSLNDALEEGRRLQGRDATRWDYGLYNELPLQHPVLAQVPGLPYLAAVPLIGPSLRANVGPVPMSGASTTVKQITRRIGPSMRFVADLADWDRSRMNLTVGESGQYLSRHYQDQWPAYYAGESFVLPFRQMPGREVLQVEPLPAR